MVGFDVVHLLFCEDTTCTVEGVIRNAFSHLSMLSGSNTIDSIGTLLLGSFVLQDGHVTILLILEI